MEWGTFPPICISSSAQLHKGALGPFTAFTTCSSVSAPWSSFYPFMLTGTSLPVPCPTSLWAPCDNKLSLSSCDKLISSSESEWHLLTPLHELHAGVECCRLLPSPSAGPRGWDTSCRCLGLCLTFPELRNTHQDPCTGHRDSALSYFCCKRDMFWDHCFRTTLGHRF